MDNLHRTIGKDSQDASNDGYEAGFKKGYMVGLEIGKAVERNAARVFFRSSELGGYKTVYGNIPTAEEVWEKFRQEGN